MSKLVAGRTMLVVGAILVAAGGILVAGNTQGFLTTFPFAGLLVGSLGGLVTLSGYSYKRSEDREFFETASTGEVERALRRRLAGIRFLSLFSALFILVSFTIVPRIWFVSHALGATLVAALATLLMGGRGWTWWSDLRAKRVVLMNQLSQLTDATSRPA